MGKRCREPRARHTTPMANGTVAFTGKEVLQRFVVEEALGGARARNFSCVFTSGNRESFKCVIENRWHS